MINAMKCSWRPATSCAPHRCILGKLLYIIFINDLDDGAESTLIKSADHIKMGGVDDTSESCAAIQRKLYRLEKWTKRDFIMFNKGKNEVLHLDKNNILICHRPTSREGSGGPSGSVM